MRSLFKKKALAGCWWLMPVILATQEQRSGGSQFEVSLGHKSETLFQKHPTQKTLVDWLKC
jgi:hypothetical protein